MGEYVKYKGKEIKIGTCESLYYVSFPKYIRALDAGLLQKLESNLAPSEYARPDSGFCFRFPFPDEDHLPLGKILEEEGFRRGIPVIVEPGYQLEITQQKLVQRQSDGKLCLALICRDPSDSNLYRLEDDDEVGKVLAGLIRNIALEDDPEKKSFYRKIGTRILKGYRLEPPARKHRLHAGNPRKAPPVKQNRGKKRRM